MIEILLKFCRDLAVNGFDCPNSIVFNEKEYFDFFKHMPEFKGNPYKSFTLNTELGPIIIENGEK